MHKHSSYSYFPVPYRKRVWKRVKHRKAVIPVRVRATSKTCTATLSISLNVALDWGANWQLHFHKLQMDTLPSCTFTFFLTVFHSCKTVRATLCDAAMQTELQGIAQQLLLKRWLCWCWWAGRPGKAGAARGWRTRFTWKTLETEQFLHCLSMWQEERA